MSRWCFSGAHTFARDYAGIHAPHTPRSTPSQSGGNNDGIHPESSSCVLEASFSAETAQNPETQCPDWYPVNTTECQNANPKSNVQNLVNRHAGTRNPLATRACLATLHLTRIQALAPGNCMIWGLSKL